MTAAELIEHLERMDPDTIVLTGDRGYVEKLSAPSLYETIFVKDNGDGTWSDVTDRERDRDIPGVVIR